MSHFILVCCRSCVCCEKSSTANSQELIQHIINLLQDEIFDIVSNLCLYSILKVCTRFSFCLFFPKAPFCCHFFRSLPAWEGPVFDHNVVCHFFYLPGPSFVFLPLWRFLRVPLCRQARTLGMFLRIKFCPTLKLELDLPFQNGLPIFTLGVFSHLQRENLVSQLLSKITHSLIYLHGKKALMACSFKGF